MTIEVKNLEADFYYVKEECLEEKAKAGKDLREFGRRFIELIDEFLPQKMTDLDNRSWVKLKKSASNSNNNASKETGVNGPVAVCSNGTDKETTTIKSATQTKAKTLIDKDTINHQHVTIQIPNL